MEFPEGLNRLRKKGKEEENLPNDIPQGLKPAPYFEALAARLKSCPDTKLGFFRSL